MSLKQYFKQSHPDIVRILRLTSYEASGWLAHLSGKVSPGKRARLSRLRRERGLKLHIASGPTPIEGWLNIDVSSNADVQLDLRRRIPLADNSAAMIFCEHFCDHIAYPAKIQFFLGECYRLLEKGGTARFVMHDGFPLMKAYVEGDRDYFVKAEMLTDDVRFPIESVNILFRFNDFHQFIYDYELFSTLLTEAGFATVRRCGYMQSDVPGLALDAQGESREVMSMYIEAVK